MISEKLKKLLPPLQLKAMEGNTEIEEQVKRMNSEADIICELGETDNMKKHPLFLHYFIGGSDWYICEWDGEDEFFGYAILNNDLHNSEWGYMSRTELLSLEFPGKLLLINLDLFCPYKTIEEALYARDERYFAKYGG